MQRCHETAGPSGRFQAFLHEPVEQLHLSPSDNAITGVSTATRRVSAAQGVVLAAGAWSGHLLGTATGGKQWHEVFKPRRGHLLELQLPHGMPPLHHGLMESSYRQHLHKAGPLDDSAPDVSFTATPSASGSCLLGSAREFSGWDTQPSQSIMKAILQRAATFLPDLHGYSMSAADDVRVGLRPYALGGLPFIGPVHEIPGLFLAAGHEGAGLTMAPATAELLVQHLMHERIALGDFADEFLPSHRMQAALAGLTSTIGHA